MLIRRCGQKLGPKIRKEVYMYALEDRKRAVELYLKYGRHAAPVMRELGYPNYKSLIVFSLA